MVLRVLFIEFENVPQEKDDEEFKLIKIPNDLPTIYDYHIVFISPLMIYNKYDELNRKSTQFEYFLVAPFGGIIITPIVGSSYYYFWLPSRIRPDVIEASGEKIIIIVSDINF